MDYWQHGCRYRGEKQGTLAGDCARTIAILLVSFNHAANRAFASDQFQEFMTRPHVISFLHAVLNVLSRMGVPLFLMITGALLLRRDYTDRRVLNRFFKHNMLSLFISTEIWYAIVFWFRVIIDRPEFISLGTGEVVKRFIMNQLFLNQYTLGNMWYMPMILVIYLLIPVISLAIHNFPKQYIWSCCGFVVLSSMLITNINTFLALKGSDLTLTFKLSETSLFSRYMVYVIAGYYIHEGELSRIGKHLLYVLLGFCSIFMFCYQYWGYSHPETYSVYYNSAGILLTSALLFETIRRIRITDGWNAFFRYISGRALAIYFVHMPIVVGIESQYLENSTLHELIQFAMLELTGVLGAMLIITLLEKNRWCRQYLFLIK